jgi:hypothetical protein
VKRRKRDEGRIEELKNSWQSQAAKPNGKIEKQGIASRTLAIPCFIIEDILRP